MTTVLDALCDAIMRSAMVNSAVSAAPSAILWTDEKREWEAGLDEIRAALPQLLTLGDYAPDSRRGPAVWLKAAIAGLIDSPPPDDLIPVVYLPGVSRAQLRGVETTPRDLQPLVELQFRGAWFTQASSRDWTLLAFMTSPTGLAFNTAGDGIRETLVRAYAAGELLAQDVTDLARSPLTAARLDALLDPDPDRAILQWIADPSGTQTRWSRARWELFVSRAMKDYGFHPEDDGALFAAEKLATRTGPWKKVWRAYVDFFSAHPGVMQLLEQVDPPKALRSTAKLEGYPSANVEAEVALRQELAAVAELPAGQARTRVIELDGEHAHRRGWVWAQNGMAPVGQALEELARIAAATTTAVSGSSTHQLAALYADKLWQVDAAVMRAMSSVSTMSDATLVSGVLATTYGAWIDDTARLLQNLAQEEPQFAQQPRPSYVVDPGTCVVFVDGLRVDAAHALEALLVNARSRIEWGWTSIPTLTPSGKPWCSPIAENFSGLDTDVEFAPSITASAKRLTTDSLRGELKNSGFQILKIDDLGDPSGRGWYEFGEIDHFGHNQSVHLPRELPVLLGRLAEIIESLSAAGWARVRVVTDHGWVYLPGGLPKVELASHATETKWARSAVLTAAATDAPIVLGWSWNTATRIALAPGVGAYRRGLVYAHGGLSLQESVVPTMTIEFDSPSAGINAKIGTVSWTGMRVRVDVAAIDPHLRVDIRTKINDPSSSLAAAVKVLGDGNPSLVVPDDDYEGSAAVIVLLDATGHVVAKASTTVGG